jgi:capsule polysaccharide export protein KpsE/RkpR
MMLSQAGSGLAGPLLSSGLGDLLGKHDSSALFVDMLHSRTVLDRIIQHFDLRKVYGVRYWEDARRKLAARSSISQDRKSGVITIMVMDQDPQRAAKLAQAYIDELDRIVADVNTSSARRERQFIEQRLKAVKQDLDEAAQNFSEFASKNATLDLQAQGKATLEAAATLQGQLIAAQSQLQGLEQIYSDDNVRTRAARARVDELRRQLKKLGGAAPNESGSTGSNFQQVDEFPSVRELPVLGVRWSDLYRQAKIQETVYALLTEEYEQAKIQEAKETPVVATLDAPVVPERKSGPHRLQITLWGGIVGFLLSSGWLLARTKWQEIDSDRPVKRLALEILAQGKIALSRVTQRLKAIGRRSQNGWSSS